MHINWRADNWIVILMRSTKTEKVDRNLSTRNYCLEKLNLLKNDGKILDDQKPHYNYPFQNNS